jgi:hypothetical protein
MTSPYKKYLQDFVGLDTKISVERAGAPSIDGKVKEVQDDAFLLESASAQDIMNDVARVYFVAYSDVRGVSHLEHAPVNPW